MLPLATETWDAAEYAAMQRVITSGRFTMGQEVLEFERQFATHFGSRFAVMVNSGSSANLAMVAAMAFHPDCYLPAGSEVLVPAVSWGTTYYPLHQYGLALRFVDVALDTMNLSPELVEAAITPQTKGVLAVNLLGNPCDLPALRGLCERRNLILLEDNCEAMGATIGGQPTGTFGRCGSFSSFFSHHISTMEGGIVVTDDEATYHLLLSIRAHGWLREQPPHSHLNIDVDDFMRLFRFVLPGYNLRPLELSGALGQEQLKKLTGLIASRRDNARHFCQLFVNHPHVSIQREIGESSWFGFAFVLRGALRGRRRDVIAALREGGIETRPIVAGNFVNNPAVRYMKHSVAGELTGADRIDRDGFFIGNHHYPVGQAFDLCRDIIDQVAAA